MSERGRKKERKTHGRRNKTERKEKGRREKKVRIMIRKRTGKAKERVNKGKNMKHTSKTTVKRAIETRRKADHYPHCDNRNDNKKCDNKGKI